jgi:hypothetical protein
MSLTVKTVTRRFGRLMRENYSTAGQNTELAFLAIKFSFQTRKLVMQTSFTAVAPQAISIVNI